MDNPSTQTASPARLRGRRAAFLLNRQEGALVAITMIWGATFLVVHAAMAFTGPLFFVGLRFCAAGLLAMLVFHRRLAAMTWAEVRAGMLIGTAIFFGYGLQTIGLQSLSASKSAFITALYVPLVPLLQWLLLKNRPHLMAWAGIILAFAGLVLLAGPDTTGTAAGSGELLTLLGALAIAMEIILIGKYSGRVNLQRVTMVQLLWAGLLAFAAMPATGESLPDYHWGWLAGALGLGVASLLIQLTMNWAQKDMSPTRATLIYSTEPVWAGIAGRMAGERLPLLALAGAALIVAGVVVSELRPRWLEHVLRGRRRQLP